VSSSGLKGNNGPNRFERCPRGELLAVDPSTLPFSQGIEAKPKNHVLSPARRAGGPDGIAGFRQRRGLLLRLFHALLGFCCSSSGGGQMGQKKNIKTKAIRPLLSSSGVKNKANFLG
jgi:hypothetical protein